MNKPMTPNWPWLTRRYYRASLGIFLTLFFYAAAANSAEVLPPQGDPVDWACADTLNVDLEQAIAAFCQVPDNRNRSPSGFAGVPASILTLEDKNKFDVKFGQWLGQFEYRDWVADQSWRFTGPVVGEWQNEHLSGDSKSYGVHPIVRVYYSPQVVDWLCGGREGDLPDGSIIIKEMLSLSEPQVALDAQSCMSVPEQKIDDSNIFWTVMIKNQAASQDGWYWFGNASGGNPPIADRSAVADQNSIPASPVKAPNPSWYPTNTLSSYSVNGTTYQTQPITVTPYNGYGAYCINCHASAQSEFTYASLENVVSDGIQYHFYKPEEALATAKRQAAATQQPSGAKHDKAPVAALSAAKKASQQSSAAQAQRPPPFSTPLQAPNPDFVSFYNQLAPVDFSQAWDLRLPAISYDHQVSGAIGPGQFLTSDQCQGCHDATGSNSGTPNMVFTNQRGEAVNLSPYATWRASPMGLAGRDPIFFSQLQSETNNLPQLTQCIENTCLHCHGVMGQRQLAIDTQDSYQGEDCKSIFPVPPPEQVPFGQPFSLADVTRYQNSQKNLPAGHNGHGNYGGLARDGISCTVCHHIDEKNLGEESGFTGNFITGPADQLNGPYADDSIVPKPMQHALGITPRFAKQIQSSQLCNSCHNILLPVFTNEGKPQPASYEQTTGLEWQNSQFAWPGETFQSCQDCHMRTDFEGQPLVTEIANIEASNNFPPTTHRLPDEEIHLTERKHFARHTLLGLNVFLNEFFQQFPVILGLQQIDYMNGNTQPALTHARDQFIDIAQRATAKLSVSPLVFEENQVSAEVTVENLAGHYLPSGVGFRRVILEYRLLDTQGQTLWCSGCTNDLGVIVDGSKLENGQFPPLPSELPIANPTAYQPHYQQITEQSQAQIYQELIKDSAGDFTTSFLRRVTHVKDNRLRPKGYDPKFFLKNFDSEYIHELANTYGEAANDPYYTEPDLTGADKIVYRAKLPLDVLKRVASAEVRLYNQSIPPFYLQQRFRDANRGPAQKNEIQRLWYLTSHLNTNTQVGNLAYIKQWKLGLACSWMDTAGVSGGCQL